MIDSGMVMVTVVAMVPVELAVLLPRVSITTTEEVIEVRVVLGVIVVLMPV